MPETNDQLGLCDFKQYEHCGPHERIPDVGQRMPPFGCKNWMPKTNDENTSTPRDDVELVDASTAFDEWWAQKEAEGYRYGREPLSTVRFGFTSGYAKGAATNSARIAELEAALRLLLDGLPVSPDSDDGDKAIKPYQLGLLTVGQIRAARAALAKKE